MAIRVLSVEDAEKLMKLSIKAGNEMIINGAEIYRAEDTVERILNSNKNISEAECVFTYSSILITFYYENKAYTAIKKVKDRKVNLEKVSLINSLSREFVSSSMNLDLAESLLEKIINSGEISEYKKTIMSALGCSLFTLTIGRSFKDFLAAFFATIISQIFLRVTRAGGRKYFMETLIGGLIATIFALIFSRLNLIDKVENVIVGSILILFPGLSLTNAVRDIMNGDMVSGMVGFIHAIFVAIALALGVGMIIKLNVFLGA